MPGKITVYLDLVSPFAYMGFYLLRHSPAFKDVQITYVPILLGGLFKATGNVAPLTVKNKDVWINKERLRWSSLFSIPICQPMPPGFPVNMIKPNRLLAYLSLKHPNTPHLVAAYDALYASFWGGANSNIAVAQPDGEAGFLAILSKVLPEDIMKDVEQDWGGEEAKKALAGNTEKVEKEEGAFGLPWFVCENAKGEREAFWGVDHLGVVVRFMGLQGEDETAGKKQVLRALL